MRILIVANNPELSRVWARHLERQDHTATVLKSQSETVAYLSDLSVDVIVLDLMLKDGSPFAVADYASYRRPEARIVFVTNSTFFSDGSLFSHIPNTAAVVGEQTPPNDLAEIIAYHGRAG